MKTETFNRRADKTRKAEQAILNARCPRCHSRLRWMPSPSDPRIKLCFCDNRDNPACNFQIDTP